jgi:hypothetical protein
MGSLSAVSLQSQLLASFRLWKTLLALFDQECQDAFRPGWLEGQSGLAMDAVV